MLFYLLNKRSFIFATVGESDFNINGRRPDIHGILTSSGSDIFQCNISGGEICKLDRFN